VLTRKRVGVAFASIVLHIVFVILSYDEEFLSKLSAIGDPIIIHRIFMSLQFLPLIVVLSMQTLRKRDLVFLTFGICVSTLFIVNDFASGFYGSILTHDSGLMPRMRASAHLMAYRDVGKIIFLDYHGEYFLEYIIVHFISEITDVDYILVYAFPIRLFQIILWALIFTVVCFSVLSEKSSGLWYLLVAASFLIANQGYNYEVSFAPLALLILFLLLNKERSLQNNVSVILMVLAVLFASFRETLTLTILSTIALVIGFIYSAYLRPLVLTITILGLGRALIFSSLHYFEAYVNTFLNLIRSIWQALVEGPTIEKGFLTAVSAIKNPVDRAIGMLSAVSMISLLTTLALASLVYITRYSQRTFLRATLITYILVYTIPLAQYGVNVMLGYGFDFGSSTTLARSLAPLTAMALAYYSSSHGRSGEDRGNRLKHVITVLLMILLSVVVVFAPLTFMARGEVKSAYDVVNVNGDSSEKSSLGNNLYHFIVTSRAENTFVVLDPSSRFLQLFYQLPLSYVIKSTCQIGEAPPSSNTVYSNGTIVALFSSDSIFLKEVK